MSHTKSRRKVVAVCLLVLLAGAVSYKLDLFATGRTTYEQIQRFMEVVQIVSRVYFEEVDSTVLINDAIDGMLEKLDPHTVYISEDRVQEINEQFDGEFEGIGIEFIVHDKYPTIISPISGSPAERLGLRSGDKIVKIEGKSTYDITDDDVRKQLLGPKGSSVSVEIMRAGLEEPFEVTITRDKIPIYSISAKLMLDATTGFIKVGRFAKTTDAEFSQALDELQSQGMKQLILDLRGNSGGLLNQAVAMADRFLDGGKRIVYTRGRIRNSNEDYYSTDGSSFSDLPLLVMINHGSASASEIVAGAIQDWDRGLIVGVTSFGKGLVQNQLILKDGSALRVTIARYYTPSGRLIQRSYDDGSSDYVAEAYDDVDPNAVADTTGDRPVFTTKNGRKVYGGGGITPDRKLKSNAVSMSTIRLIQGRMFFDFGALLAEREKTGMRDFEYFVEMYKVDAATVDEFIDWAKTKSPELDLVDQEIDRDASFMQRRLKSQMAQHLWGSEEYNCVEVSEDQQVILAREYLPEAAKIAELRSSR